MKNRGSAQLRRILAQAQRPGTQKERVYVFDLDSTLFDVGPRMLSIMKAFAQTPSSQANYPRVCAVFDELSHLPQTFHFENILAELGIQDESAAFRADILAFWKERFFSNDWLHLDKPYPGAQDFVRKLGEAGVKSSI